MTFDNQRASLLVSWITRDCLIGRHPQRLGARYHDYSRSCGDENEEENVDHLPYCPAVARKRLVKMASASFQGLSDICGV